ncbi:MAG: ATP-dependent DNA helicase RecG [Bacillota bacterium]|nr:ATP-dependent DNA helicase RecG [Bacillota bacterium]
MEPPGIEQVARELRAILRQEGRDGFRDRTVVGGVEAYVRQRLEPLLARSEQAGTAREGTWLADVSRRLRAYAEASPDRRRSLAEALLERLGEIERRAGAGAEGGRESGAEAPARRKGAGAEQTLEPAEPVTRLRGVGGRQAAALGRLEIRTVADLLFRLPLRYEDWREPVPIARLQAGSEQLAAGVVTAVRRWQARRGLEMVDAVLRDASGTLVLRWFNQPFRERQLAPGQRLAAFGRVEQFQGRWMMQSPEVENLDEPDGRVGRLVPVYPAGQGLSQGLLRRWYRQAVERTAGETGSVPEEARRRHGFLALGEAWRAVHLPRTPEEAELGRRSLAFEELWLLELGLGLLRRRAREGLPGVRHAPGGERVRRFREALPYRLTAGQEAAWREIEADMEGPLSMNRLLQGDVGSGKTVLAAMTILKSVDSGYQGALMAPTEILAEQHWLGLAPRFREVGVEMGLLRGGMAAAERQALLERLATGGLPAVVGTHALLEEDVRFARLGSVVIDEQHRFGVEQRAALQQKAARMGARPDVLVMTATPIPRTLALTLYGDLDLSLLRDMPPGRGPVRTRLFPPAAREAAYGRLEAHLRAGHRAYVVCPRIGEGDEEEEAPEGRAGETLPGAVPLARELARRHPGWRIGLLHGRLPVREKASVMEAFARGEVQVLVATTVVEVGVDVPEATAILIEGADSFGLAQLHQLRGRVGRGPFASECLLLASRDQGPGWERLETLARTRDGFALAEADLALRGPGEFLGKRQHGLPELRVADPAGDRELLELARRESERLLEGDPRLERPEHRFLRRELARRFPQLDLFFVG